MCNLYSQAKGQAAINVLLRQINDRNLPPLRGACLTIRPRSSAARPAGTNWPWSRRGMPSCSQAIYGN